MFKMWYNYNRSELIMNNVVINKQKEFKHKMIKLIFAVALSILLVCIILGTIDFFRTKNGKKPLFIYSKNVESALDIGVAGFEEVVLSNKDGATYYGAGYTISICDTDTKKYAFKLGYSKAKPCNISLSCNSSKKGSLVLNEDSTVSYNKSDYDSYYYSCYEGKLDKVIATLIRPLSSIENLDTSSAEIEKFYENVPGC